MKIFIIAMLAYLGVDDVCTLGEEEGDSSPSKKDRFMRKGAIELCRIDGNYR